MTPYYDDGGITLYHGDCLEILRGIPDSADLFFTSPPYNLGGSPWPHLGNWKPGDSADGKSKWRNGSDGSGGVSYDDHDDTMEHDHYVRWQHDVLSACWDNLSPSGAIFYNHKPRVIGAKCWLPLELNPGLPLRQIVTWARAGGMNFNPTAYVPTYEWLMVFAKDDFRLKSKAASGLGDVWTVPQSPSPHPAPFPIGLPARAIETVVATLVIDPFSGSGTTLRAAKDAGVRAIGIEKSERWCEYTANRLGQESLFGSAA
jgi:site-specific DNA-methyltransferase (adenine-specific)